MIKSKEVKTTIEHTFCDICGAEYGLLEDVTIQCLVSYDEYEGEHSGCHFDICPNCFVTKVIKLLMDTYKIPLYPYLTASDSPYKTWNDVVDEWGYQRGIKNNT